MTTCPLCGQRDHTGPRYADLKEEWREQDRETWITLHGFKAMKVEGELETWVRTVVLRRDAS